MFSLDDALGSKEMPKPGQKLKPSIPTSAPKKIPHPVPSHSENTKKRPRNDTNPSSSTSEVLEPPVKIAKTQEKKSTFKSSSVLEQSKKRIEELRDQIKLAEQQNQELYAISDLFEKPIDNIKDCFEACKRLKKCKVIAADAEWSGRGREAKLCLLQVSFFIDESTYQVGVYLFDIYSGGSELFDQGGLREVLESDEILKVFHDCRQDSDVLFHSQNVKLNHVIDTQILYNFMVSQQYNYTCLPVSLNTLLKKYAGRDGATNSNKEEAHKLMEQNPLFWEIRPMTKLMIDYAREDVLYLLQAYKRLWSGIDSRNHKLAYNYSREYLNQIRSLKEFPHDRYSGNSLPKYGIELWDMQAKSRWELLNLKYPDRLNRKKNEDDSDEKKSDQKKSDEKKSDEKKSDENNKSNEKNEVVSNSSNSVQANVQKEQKDQNKPLIPPKQPAKLPPKQPARLPFFQPAKPYMDHNVVRRNQDVQHFVGQNSTKIISQLPEKPKMQVIQFPEKPKMQVNQIPAKPKLQDKEPSR